MQTGTVTLPKIGYNKYTLTIILLCIGYYIDFYDLTLFYSSYVSVFRESFHIYNATQIQQLFLRISSFYTAGIFCGAVFFGVIGDKIGRTAMIRYSVLLYSVSMILSVFTTSIPLFTLLRFISGAGLAAEFATSSVLLHELLPTKHASKYTSLLYFCGVLGGMTAVYFGSLSWKLLYLFGGFAGVVIYIARNKIFESHIYTNLHKQVTRGNILQLFNGWSNSFKFIKLLILIIPFNFLISIMFIYPKFMNVTGDLGLLTRQLLTGFFIGNLLSTLLCNLVINKFKDYRTFILFNILLFTIVMPLFWIINDKLFFMYSVALGLLGGGLPTVWVQLVVKSYGTNLRSTATNTLFAFGRVSCIGFNALIGLCLLTPTHFRVNVLIMVIVIVALVLFSLLNIKNNYLTNMEFLESNRK